MTSKNSFWASCRENHKRRIWVWIVAVLSQLLPYGGITMIYLSRIKDYNAHGIYRTAAEFQDALYRAVKDALGFSDDMYKIIIPLAALIGMQGFSYLYNRRKVDLYHSVPVTKNRRFAAVYLNGLFMYLAANLTGILFGLVIAASQGAVNGSVLTDVGLAFLWNLVMFLVFYHMMILAVMLTGNWFVTICGFAALALYEFVVRLLIEDMMENFFRTYTNYFQSYGLKLSVLTDVTNNIWYLKNLPDTAAKAALALPFVGRWILIAAALLLLAYAAYRKRPSEAAGKAIAFPILEPFLKVAVVIPAALMVGILVYSTSMKNEVLQVLAMAVAGVIFCCVMEVLYDFDIRSLFKHLVSSGVALVGVLAIFCIFKWDLFGYDNYLPAQNKVESIAILTDGYYDGYWDENLQYMEDSAYVREHMFLTDAEPVLALAQAYLQTDEAAVEEMTAPRTVRILYRLHSGREAVRAIRVDYEDAETAALLNRIFQTAEFKKGTFQAMTDETSYDRVTGIAYTNGAVRVAVPKEQVLQLRDAWIKDMEQVDFTFARDNRPCGQLYFDYDNYSSRQWQVYESFENTIALLKKLEAYYPVQLNAEDIDSITVTCYHNELTEAGANTRTYTTMRGNTAQSVRVDDVYRDYTVRETFYEEEQIAKILPHIHPEYLDSYWGGYKATDGNYAVEVVFKKNTDYPYQRDSYYFSYNFITGEVPDFVAEATAYTE